MSLLWQNRLWFLAGAAVSILVLSIVFAPGVSGKGSPGDRPNGVASTLPEPGGDQQIFNQDLLVESGEVVDDNVAVFRGDAEVRQGGEIRGNLSVFGGDVWVAGSIQGDLAVIGGDLQIDETAHIAGNVSLVGGRAERAPGAYVGGSFVGGPGSFQDQRLLDMMAGQFTWPSQRSPILAFVLRLMQAGFWTLVTSALAVFIYWLFPRDIAQVSDVIDDEPVLSLFTGAVAMTGTLIVSLLLGITIILLCFSLLLVGLLAIIMLIGWSATSVWLGRRLQSALYNQANTKPGLPVDMNGKPAMDRLLPVTLSALLITGITFVGWSILPCLGLIAALAIGSIGTGAILVYQVRRSQQNGRPPETAAPGGSPSTEGAPTANSMVGAEEAQEPTPAPSGSPTQTRADDLPPGAEETGHHSDSRQDTGIRAEDEHHPEDADLGAGPPRSEMVAPSARPVDFTRIKGIGPAFNRRLHSAGIVSYQQLATMSTEEVAEILGWPAERVQRDRLIEQAARLAEGR